MGRVGLCREGIQGSRIQIKQQKVHAGTNNCTCCSFSAAELGCLDRILKDCGNQTWEEELGTAGQLIIKKMQKLHQNRAATNNYLHN